MKKKELTREDHELAASESAACSYENLHFNEKPKLVLVGTDGNAFALLGKAMRVAKQNKMDWEKIQKEATSGDYDHLLCTLMEYFDVE